MTGRIGNNPGHVAKSQIKRGFKMIAAAYNARFCTGMRTPLALLLVLVLGFALPASAQDRALTVSVSGEGTIKVSPDMATIWFSVVTHDELPDRARAQNADASAAAMNAARELGIEEKDLQLEGLQLAPRRVYDPDRRVYNQDGFEATRTVKVIMRDLDVLPDLIASIVENGANQLNNIQYGLEDRESIELEALARAVNRAKEKASVMAGELGWALGKAIQINEQGVSVPQPRVQMEALAMRAKDDGGNPDAFAAGELDVRASVTVVFGLLEPNE